MDFLKIVDESENGFKAIAEKLFNDYAIQTHESSYRITELEFYWTSKTHKDGSVYKRIHTNPKTGEWYLHYSGVDIALRNDENEGFGGILIRSIYDLNEKNERKIYKGPMICAMRLFSGTNAFEKFIQARLVQHDQFSKPEIMISERIGLGKNAAENGADKLRYRFFINHSEATII